MGAHDGDNRLDLIAKGQREKPVSMRQLENNRMSPVSETTPLSTVENNPIIKPYKGIQLVFSRSNSYLFHKLFPSANSYVLRRNDNEGKSSSFYSKPFKQNAILTSLFPNSHKGRTYSVTRHPAEGGSLRNRSSVSQTNTLASNIGLYENQNKITSSSPLVNGYLKDSTFRYPNDGITHSFHNIETGQASPTNPYSYLRLPIKTTQSDNFQLTQYSFFKPVSTNVAKDPAFRSPSYSTFYPHPPLPRKGRNISPAKDKVVTEGELNEKGLLSDILSRDHIRRKPSKVKKEQL